METSYLKTLELDKIIARAAEGCVCKESREKLLAIEPQCDPDEVRYALEQTDAINSLLIKNGSPRFGGVEGVSQLAARAVKGGVLSMGELLMVAGALRNFQNLVSWYGSSEHDALPTDDLFYALAPQPGLEQQISSAILAPDAMADTASHTLNDLRKKIRATENSIRDRLESMVRNMDTSKYLQESVVSIRNGRYVVPVKSEYRGEVSGIIHDVSSTGATVFVEPQAVVEANARILQYRAQEAQEIERILVAFTGQVAAIEPQFQYSYKAMLEIDVLLAKARLADPDPIMNAVTEWVASHTFAELKEKCDKAGVPISSVYSMKDIFEDPQYAARHDIVEVPCGEFGSIKMPGVFPVLSETPGQIKWAGPKIGAQNEDIYHGLLGMSDEEIAELKEKKVI